MIEIRQMKTIQRLLLLLRDAAAAQPPVGLRGLHRENLRGTGSALAAKVRDALARQSQLRSPQGARFPGETVLRRYANLDSDIGRQISRDFPTRGRVHQCRPDQIVRRLNINQSTVRAIQTSLTNAANVPYDR
jgi:hypothetical protein